MKQFLTVFKTSFKYLWRNPASVCILTLFPIVLILILGTALSSYISPDTALETASAAVVTDNQNSDFSEFLKSDEISRFLEADFTDEENARQLLEEDAVNLVIFEKDGEISVLKNYYSGMYAEIALSVVDSYRQIGAAATMRIARTGDFAAIGNLLEKEVAVTEQPLNKNVPSATDYYAVTISVMILMYTGLNGLELFKKSLLSETGDRVRTAPVSKPVLIGGLIAASTVTSYLQGMVTFAFSAVVYKVNWGERVPLILLTLFAVCLFSQSLAVFLLMLFKSPGAANGATMALIWITTFISKGYAKVTFGPADKVFAYAPNALAHNVIFGAVYGGNESKMFFDLCLLFALGLALFILALLLGRRKLS